jgi:hypothetical protein
MFLEFDYLLDLSPEENLSYPFVEEEMNLFEHRDCKTKESKPKAKQSKAKQTKRVKTPEKERIEEET